MGSSSEGSSWVFTPSHHGFSQSLTHLLVLGVISMCLVPGAWSASHAGGVLSEQRLSVTRAEQVLVVIPRRHKTSVGHRRPLAVAGLIAQQMRALPNPTVAVLNLPRGAMAAAFVVDVRGCPGTEAGVERAAICRVESVSLSAETMLLARCLATTWQTAALPVLHGSSARISQQLHLHYSL